MAVGLLAHDPAKADARSTRRQQAGMRRDQRKRERRCFYFTRPLRHEYQLMDNPGMGASYVCVGCGRQRRQRG